MHHNTRWLLCLSLIALFAFPLRSYSQEDNWDTYTASYKKGYGSTLVNLGLKKVAPIAGLPYIVVTGVMCKDCQPDGMPSKKEFELLYTISDTVQSKMNQLVKNCLAGTFTYQCDRLDYFYVADTSRIRERITRMYKVYFPTYKPYIIIRTDLDWKTYRDILYPNEENIERMENEKVVSKMVEAGDVLNKKRVVTHWIDFVTADDRACFLNYAREQEFAVELHEKMIENERLYKLKLERRDVIDLNTISKITLALHQQAKKCKGIYEGWECPVVKQ